MISKEKRTVYNIVINVLSILIISFYGLVSISSAAYERPAYDQALTAPWHPGSYCIPCHFSLMDSGTAQKISNTCKCHDYKPAGSTGGYTINMTKIYDIHKDIMCIRCHIGMKSQQNVTAQDFHRIMPIACSNCHNYTNGTIQIPEKKNCSDCHADGNPHIVHGKKVEVLCVACHGEEFANKYINRPIQITDKGIVTLSGNVTVREYPTITGYLSNILGILSRIGS
jgi:hypothetical protein